ncbi:MAG: formate dehydrogenase accessory sulfurtransferase FdhD [Thermoprotei archaeon]|nr:MAG: formate dehydrogenase accessory sulfurtransferase FdhD [Thermoprotei archaeon]
MFVSVKISRISIARNKIEFLPDSVAVEVFLKVFVNGKPYVTFLASPSMLKELIIGNLLSEGIINGLEEIEEIRIDNSKANVEILKNGETKEKLSGILPLYCTEGEINKLEKMTRGFRIESDFKIEAKALIESFKELHKKMSVFRITGCTHGAALANEEGKIVALAEDLGRHNAVDKVVGYAALKGLDLKSHALLTTGRVTPLLVLKAATVGIPVVCSSSAATLSSIRLAKAFNITLAGFVRGNRINIYANPQRITLSGQAEI